MSSQLLRRGSSNLCMIQARSTHSAFRQIRRATYASTWKRTNDVPLTRDNFLDLLNGRTPTIREDGFVTPEQSFGFEKELSAKLTPYKHNTGPLLQKVGVAQFEYQAQAQEDFHKRSDGNSRFSSQCKCHTDVIYQKRTNISRRQTDGEACMTSSNRK